jgi:hypothetical protein
MEKLNDKKPTFELYKAFRTFNCPGCGCKILKGDNYIQDGSKNVCIACAYQSTERKLIPINDYIAKFGKMFNLKRDKNGKLYFDTRRAEPTGSH